MDKIQQIYIFIHHFTLYMRGMIDAVSLYM